MPCGCSHMQRGRCAEKSDVTFSVLGKANSVWARTQCSLMAILECRTMIVNNTGKVSWWLSVVFLKACLSNLEGTVVFFLCTCNEIEPAVFLPLYLASSFNFPSLSLSLPLLWRPWETQGKRGIQYQVLIHTHHHTEGKNVGSGAAQFRLDSAIDRMLYQPLPWQLTRARTEPQRLFTPVSYSLPPHSAI